LERFRNSDDAYVYQSAWMRNAAYQAGYHEALDQLRERQSFDWAFRQALPDGSPLNYNHIVGRAAEQTAYWGATRLQDPQYMWLAGRSIEWLDAHDRGAQAYNFLDSPIDLTGVSPDWGSCLLYSDSGLPNQSGPLGPDKIIFRDGWEPGSAYLLLNLRFTGWHRYKATNGVTLLYQGEPLVEEVYSDQYFRWLPLGRQLFRDKRIPRENLNGLLVERSGLSAAVYGLAGFGGEWAQDPPYYAQVERFTTGTDMDSCLTELDGWRGWQQRRGIYFSHDGPIVIHDAIQGPARQAAALIWNIAGKGQRLAPGRVRIEAGALPAEVLFVPLDGGSAEARLAVQPQVEAGVARLIYQPEQPGGFEVLTVFLSGPWAGAEAALLQDGDQRKLHLQQADQTLEIPIQP
jgi:hypothetical protein